MFKLGNSCLPSKRKAQINRKSKKRLVQWETLNDFLKNPSFGLKKQMRVLTGNHLLLLKWFQQIFIVKYLLGSSTELCIIEEASHLSQVISISSNKMQVTAMYPNVQQRQRAFKVVGRREDSCELEASGI